MSARDGAADAGAPARPAPPECAACGAAFACGAADGACWCFDVAISPARRVELERVHPAGGCLCPACLPAFASEPATLADRGR